MLFELKTRSMLFAVPNVSFLHQCLFSAATPFFLSDLINVDVSVRESERETERERERERRRERQR